MESVRTDSALPKHQWLVNEQAIAAIAPDPDNDGSSLESNELEQVYDIFRFYDSSFHGDKLPSISLPRFIEVLKDGHILSSTFTAHQAEEVFATAVLGKLRTYLDADGTPALSFKLFCGALMHCATIKYPTLAPSSALRKLVRRHLFLLMSEIAQGGGDTRLMGSKSVAGAVGDNYWHPLDAQHETRQQKRRCDRPRDHVQMLLVSSSVSQVAYDRVVRQILPEPDAPVDTAITPEVAAHFTPNHVALVIDRFHLFDHSEQGVLGADEVFIFLHGLADALGLGNVQPLARQLSRVANVTLSEVFQVLMGCVPRADGGGASILMAKSGGSRPVSRAAAQESAAMDTVDMKQALLSLSHDCPPDNWDLDDGAATVSDLVLLSATPAPTIGVIKRVTISNSTTTVKKSKRQFLQPTAAAPLPRVLMLHLGSNEHSIKKFWEGTVRLGGLVETSGLVQAGEKRMLTETNTRLKTTDASISLLCLRVKYKLNEGYVVTEGKKHVADIVAQDIKAKKASALHLRRHRGSPKKLTLDKSSTVVRSAPLLPPYSPTNHTPLYNAATYQLPTNWQEKFKHETVGRISLWSHDERHVV
ncbi:Aste57867_14039 [Aphanomyces stellatus]|uniref:Aste57867_14039 protein n=1 Tax=Aphanomyces stellatus TaxID=120398 RepID=A0A485L002_9STRA|nr:hypothetical protein As57867_013988 [Aphanomyces stellatus]VFT90869.1 Aste57867_14039 [Aphanomyces stellatus]